MPMIRQQQFVWCRHLVLLLLMMIPKKQIEAGLASICLKEPRFRSGFRDAYGKQKAYAKVRIEAGECKGNEAWALAIDVQ